MCYIGRFPQVLAFLYDCHTGRWHGDSVVHQEAYSLTLEPLLCPRKTVAAMMLCVKILAPPVRNAATKYVPTCLGK